MGKPFFGMFSGDADIADGSDLEKTRELIELKAALNDTGGASRFTDLEDFPCTEIVCVELMGDEAIQAWADAQNAQRATRPDVVEKLTAGLGDLEVVKGAAHDSSSEPKDVKIDVWQSVRTRMV